MKSILMIAAAALSYLGSAMAGLEVIPARPVAGEPFVLYVFGDARSSLKGYSYYQSTSSLNGSLLEVHTNVDAPIGFGGTGGCFGCPFSPSYRTFISATLPAPGSYSVSNSLRDNLGAFQEIVGNVVVDPPRAAATPQFTNLSGNYFAPDENGAGVNLLQNAAGQLFVAWAGYGSGPFATSVYYHNYLDASWLVMPEGKWISSTEFQGVLYSTLGTRYSEPWNASKAYSSPVGVLNLKFVDRNQVDIDAQFAYPSRKQKRLTRLQF